MLAQDNLALCDVCRIGHVTKRFEEVAFRQWSDKEYVHCRVTVLIGTCAHCRTKSTDPEAINIFDDAFRREYEKLQ